MKTRGQNRYKNINYKYKNDKNYKNRIDAQRKEVGKKMRDRYEKYGLPKKWVEWYEKFSKFGKSKLEDKVFDYITKKTNKVERWYPISNMFVDIFIPEKKLVVECHGDYWHMNPSKYNSDDYNKSTKRYAHEQWKKDKSRKLFMESGGYNVVELWENEINRGDYKKLDIYL